MLYCGEAIPALVWKEHSTEKRKTFSVQEKKTRGKNPGLPGDKLFGRRRKKKSM